MLVCFYNEFMASPSIWQKAQAFLSPPFWKGMAQGAALGVPTALIVWSLFALMPAAMLPASMAAFTGLQVQLLFCTVFGAAGAAVNAGMQAVKALDSSNEIVAERAIAPRSPQVMTALQPGEEPTTEKHHPRIKDIVAKGPAASHQEAALISSDGPAASRALH